MTTHVLLVIDASGSMDPQAEEVRHGVNKYLNDLENPATTVPVIEHTDFSITLVTFNTVYMPHCVAVPPAEATRLDEANYIPFHATALLDAVGRTILEFEATGKRKPDDRVLLVINTDGLENSSREYTWVGIRKMIDARVENEGWGVIYMGQGVDAWDQGQRFGANTYSVHTNSGTAGTQSSYHAMTVGTRSYAGGQSVVDTAKEMQSTVDNGSE